MNIETNSAGKNSVKLNEHENSVISGCPESSCNTFTWERSCRYGRVELVIVLEETNFRSIGSFLS